MTWVSIAFATAAALVMCVAIQRGATCTVAAVEEITTHRSAKRLMALIEAALWVNAGLVIAQNRHWISELPAGYSITWWTLPGAVLLGLGAWVNKACAFGSIARLGSGELAYLATPLGFYLGCLSADTAFGNLQMTAQHNQQAIHLQFNIFLWPLLV